MQSPLRSSFRKISTLILEEEKPQERAVAKESNCDHANWDAHLIKLGRKIGANNMHNYHKRYTTERKICGTCESQSYVIIPILSSFTISFMFTSIDDLVSPYKTGTMVMVN